MTITQRIIAGLARGPATLPELLSLAKPTDRIANAANLERRGLIWRAGWRSVRAQGPMYGSGTAGYRRSVLWERVEWSAGAAFARNEQRFQAVP